MQDEFVRSFAIIGGLMKLAADIMADEIVQAPAAEDAILDDVLATLGVYIAEAKLARSHPRQPAVIDLGDASIVSSCSKLDRNSPGAKRRLATRLSPQTPDRGD